MNKKYLIGMPPRCGKTATQEMLKQLNERAHEVKLEVPVEDINVNPKELLDILVKMGMPVVNQVCPDCGGQLRYDHETECEIILYCIHCDHKIKAKKG